MRIESDIKLDFKDVLFRPKRSQLTSRKNVVLEREFDFKHSTQKWTGVPIIAANMDGVGTFTMAKSLQKHNLLTAIRKHYTVDDWHEAVKTGLKLKNVMICTGSAYQYNQEAPDYDTMKKVLAAYPDIRWICIDVANGYQQNFVDFVKRVRDEYPDKIIVAGNVITAEMVEELIIDGADVVKCGIGPGSVCTTRLMTGVGMPQLSGIIECADAAHGVGGHIIADGGCTVPGDIAKAFGGGADFVMLGGMLAGTDQSEAVIKDGKVTFYGMSSDQAMETHGGRHSYRGSEGKVVSIDYKGPVETVITDYLGGLRSTCTYVGAKRLKDIPKCTTFVQVHDQVNTVYGDGR